MSSAPSVSFAPIKDATTCTSTTFKWTYVADAKGNPYNLTLSLTNEGLKPQPSPAPPLIAAEQLISGISLQVSTDFSWTWSPVNVPAGRYAIEATVDNNAFTIPESPQFQVLNGTDLSCLTGAPYTTTPEFHDLGKTHGLGHGTIIGIVVGAISALLLTLMAFFLLTRRRRAIARTRQSLPVLRMQRKSMQEQHAQNQNQNPIRESATPTLVAEKTESHMEDAKDEDGPPQLEDSIPRLSRESSGVHRKAVPTYTVTGPEETTTTMGTGEDDAVELNGSRLHYLTPDAPPPQRF
ncbi:hypothetical protein BD410DRAFT_801789 [Rickenella mellea]|uniref:Uncharacterized protein n=1 Tax=Rickenella mellea TaxID=50990 RepID=A0A4Y7Q9T7_9AGAM|nr:hypothetical protein BD410DRAFT_801789 [Rickenella mellea]